MLKKYYDAIRNNPVLWEKQLKYMREWKRKYRKKYCCVCISCGKKFKATYDIAKFCSDKCNTGKFHHGWKGGKYVDSTGYIRIYAPNHPNRYGKHILEHRLVMEKIIGRYLHTWEIVHHINFKPQDNRPKNLMLFKNRKEHRDYHIKIQRDEMGNSLKPKKLKIEF